REAAVVLPASRGGTARHRPTAGRVRGGRQRNREQGRPRYGRRRGDRPCGVVAVRTACHGWLAPVYGVAGRAGHDGERHLRPRTGRGSPEVRAGAGAPGGGSQWEGVRLWAAGLGQRLCSLRDAPNRHQRGMRPCRNGRLSTAVAYCRGATHNLSYIIRVEVRWSRSARRHRIGRGSAREVMAARDTSITTAVTNRGEQALRYVGTDSRGRGLEIVAVVYPNFLLVIHVMPTRYREVP